MVGDLDVVELAPHMRPAGGLADAAGVVEMMEAGVAIGLQGPAEAVQMPARMLALAVRRVGEPDRRRGGIVRRAIVADIRPEPAGLGLAVARSQHRHRSIVGMQLRGGHYMPTHFIDQRA